MTARKPAARKKTTPARRKPAKRATSARKPAARRAGKKASTWLAVKLGEQAKKHSQTATSRRNAAIIRLSHEGCPKCHGNGQIAIHKKDGSFAGSKPCPAKPTKQKVSRLRVALASRFGTDKNSGLIGCTCPCGWTDKPRYRDPKQATKALRTHERRKHGGQTVGGGLAYQAPATTPQKPAPKPEPVSKVATDSGLTDEQWIKQNGRMSPAKATAKGLCWKCSGKGALYSAHGGEQITTVCPECTGNGKATTADQSTPKKETPMPKKTNEQKRQEYVKNFSMAALRAHDKGNTAAAAGLTEGAIRLMNQKGK
ncbi:hypothetical protein [Streptomyces sp. NPDC059165]|uniref:hypothetical protein n=1 Tax=Streptomyces sp. NPDC059165 TaxID=3346751 RepID=UPI0036AC88E2